MGLKERASRASMRLTARGSHSSAALRASADRDSNNSDNTASGSTTPTAATASGSTTPVPAVVRADGAVPARLGVIGSPGCGKTALVERWVLDTFRARAARAATSAGGGGGGGGGGGDKGDDVDDADDGAGTGTPAGAGAGAGAGATAAAAGSGGVDAEEAAALAQLEDFDMAVPNRPLESGSLSSFPQVEKKQGASDATSGDKDEEAAVRAAAAAAAAALSGATSPPPTPGGSSSRYETRLRRYRRPRRGQKKEAAAPAAAAAATAAADDGAGALIGLDDGDAAAAGGKDSDSDSDSESGDDGSAGDELDVQDVDAPPDLFVTRREEKVAVTFYDGSRWCDNFQRFGATVDPFEGLDGLFLCYDLSEASRASYDALDKVWKPQLDQHNNVLERMPVFVVGLKTDQPAAFDIALIKMIKPWIKESHTCSAKSGDGCAELLDAMIDDVLSRLAIKKMRARRATSARGDVGDKPHNFKKVFFKSPTWCMFCKDFIWGVTNKQGMECTECEFQCHKRCHQEVPNFCGLDNIAALREEGLRLGEGAPVSRRHNFHKVYFPRPTWCMFCKDFIWGVTNKQGMRCRECGFECHKRCHQDVPDACGMEDMDVLIRKSKNKSKKKDAAAPGDGEDDSASASASASRTISA